MSEYGAKAIARLTAIYILISALRSQTHKQQEDKPQCQRYNGSNPLGSWALRVERTKDENELVWHYNMRPTVPIPEDRLSKNVLCNNPRLGVRLAGGSLEVTFVRCRLVRNVGSVNRLFYGYKEAREIPRPSTRIVSHLH